MGKTLDDLDPPTSPLTANDKLLVRVGEEDKAATAGQVAELVAPLVAPIVDETVAGYRDEAQAAAVAAASDRAQTHLDAAASQDAKAVAQGLAAAAALSEANALTYSQIAFAAANPKDDIAQGLSDTAEGAPFLVVPNETDELTRPTYFRKVSGNEVFLFDVATGTEAELSTHILSGFEKSVIVTNLEETFGPAPADGNTGSVNNTWSSGVAITRTGPLSKVLLWIRVAGDGTGALHILSGGSSPFSDTIVANLTGLIVGANVIDLSALSVEVNSGERFAYSAATGGAQIALTTGLGSGIFSATIVGGASVAYSSTSNRPRLAIAVAYTETTIDYKTVSERLGGYEPATAIFEPEFSSGSTLTGGFIRFGNGHYLFDQQVVEEIELDVSLAGNFVVYVYSENDDGTLAYVSQTTITATATGQVTLRASDVDFTAFSIPKNGRVAIQNSGGRTTFVSDTSAQYLNAGAVGSSETPLGATGRPQFRLKVSYQPSVKNDIALLDARLNELEAGRTNVIPLASDGRNLHLVRGFAAAAQESGTAPLKIAVAGDSWAERVWIPQRLRDILGEAIGLSGHGWISVDSDFTALNDPPVQQMDGVTFQKFPRASMSNNAGALADGWITCDAAASGYTGIYDDYGLSVDGFAIATTRADATISIGNLRATSVRIFYRDTTGTFRYRADSGSWTTISCAGTNAVSSVLISGLTDTTHTIEIDTTGNAGTAVIYGAYAVRSVAGVEVSKIGNGGATSANLATISAAIGDYLSVMLPHVLILIDGTNDVASVGSTAFKANLQTYMDAVWADSPNTVIVLMPSPENSTISPENLLPFTIAGYELHIANQNKTEFFHARAVFGPRASSNLWGAWDDGLHPGSTGARGLMQPCVDKLFYGI